MHLNLFLNPVINLSELSQVLFIYHWNPLETLQTLFSYLTNIRTSTVENVLLTKVAITPTVHIFFCISFLYISIDAGFHNYLSQIFIKKVSSLMNLRISKGCLKGVPRTPLMIKQGGAKTSGGCRHPPALLSKLPL